MKYYPSKLSFLAIAVSAMLPVAGFAQVQIGNADSANTVTLNSTDSEIGQVFSVGSEPTYVDLSSFQVNLLAGTVGDGANAQVDAVLSTWDTTNNVPLTNLWSSGPTVISNGSPTIFDTGNIALDPSLTYVFSLQIDPGSDVDVNAGGTLGVSTTSSADYAAGSAYALLTATEATDLGFVGASWDGSEWVNLSGDATADEGLTFSASLTPVPEASTYAIGGVLLCLGLAVYYHRKRQVAVEVAPAV